MPEFLAKLLTRLPRSAVFVILLLTLAAAAAFAAVSHLVTRFNLNQQARGRHLYDQGLADMTAHNPSRALEEFRAALTCDRNNSLYQLNLGRALRDTGRLDEAESYLESLWERSPEDGTINLALARLAARRGSLEDATRYYHNAMYGVWGNADADSNRRKARIELIEFLMQKNALAQANAELVALAGFLPADPSLHLQAAQLFVQARDYPNALAEYEKVLRLDQSRADMNRANSASNAELETNTNTNTNKDRVAAEHEALGRSSLTALAGAGEAAYHAGHYRTAAHYLEDAVQADPEDSNSRTLHASATLILSIDPFLRRISDAERNRRIAADFTTAGNRLAACAQQNGVNLQPANATASSPSSTSASSPASPLINLQSRWLDAKKDLPHLRSIAETDLPDAIMDVVFQIEQQTATVCGDPQGEDAALLLISRQPEDADQ
jgi:tetratricopeptide (TPR) repeat protein